MTTKDTLEILKVLPNEHDVLEILTDMKKNDLRKLLKLNQKQREEWEEELRVIKTQIGMVEKEYLTIAEEAELVDILQKELAKTITPQETKSLIREFEGASLSEIKHKIKTGNMSDKAKQLIKNIIKNPIFKWVSLIMMISIIGYYIYNYRMKPYYDQKALDEYNEKVRNQNVQDSIAYEKARIQAIGDSIAFAKQKEEEEIRKVKAAEEERKREEADEIDKTTFSLQEAQDNIPQGLLIDVNYEELISTIQGVKDTSVRKLLISHLMQGDVAGAQELYGMKKYSTSPYNTADGKLDKRTLKRFSDPLFGLSKDNLLQSQEIPSDLKEVYKNFVNNTYNNKGKPYLILSKENLKAYLFSVDHKIMYHQPILAGTEKGDAEFVPYPYYKNPDGTLSWHGKKVHNTTPSGMYEGRFTIDQRIYYTPFFQLVPVDALTQKIDKRFDYDDGILGLHESGTSQRNNALASSTTADNRMTHGCIVASYEGLSVLKDNGLYIIYICKE